LEVINAPECSKSALGELLNSSDDSDGSFVKIDMNDQYAMFNFPEDPVPKDLKIPEELLALKPFPLFKRSELSGALQPWCNFSPFRSTPEIIFSNFTGLYSEMTSG
jgi:hypothetical protein